MVGLEIANTLDRSLRDIMRTPDLPFGGTWVYELAPAGAGTSLKITENAEIYHPISRLVSHLFLNQAATIEEYLRSLERKHGRGA